MPRLFLLAVACRPGGPPDAEFSVVRPAASFKATRARGSLLCLNFNRAWADALNRRSDGVTHFALQHDDITPEPGWADTLADILDATGADAVCPVIPLKDRRGLTSTGVMLPGSMGRTRRLTLREAHALPTVFGVSEARAGLAIDDPFAVLLINTGLLVVRLDRPWVERFPGFQNGYDGVHRGPDGRWRAGCFSEDWTFSAWCAGNGVKTLATTAVRCVHHGHDGDYPNGPAWGDCDTDPGED